jgi:hypothetical protein
LERARAFTHGLGLSKGNNFHRTEYHMDKMCFKLSIGSFVGCGEKFNACRSLAWTREMPFNGWAWVSNP